MKTCNKCKQTKPIDQFHVNSFAPDGRKYSCAECESIRNKKLRAEARQWRKDNRVTYNKNDSPILVKEFEKLLVLGIEKGTITTAEDVCNLLDGWNRIARIQKVV